MSAPYIDATGYHGLDLQSWTDNLTALFSGIYGADKDFSPNTQDGQLIAGLAAMIKKLDDLTAQVYESRAPAGAVGAGLSRLVGLNGITRKPAQPSAATVTLTGTPGTVIPAGSLVGSSLDNTKPSFATVGSLTIGGDGTVTGTVQCTQPGAIRAAINELSVIQTVITGWAAVTNTASAAPGLDGEADPLLRLRRAKSVAIMSQSLRDGLEAALASLPGVFDARVYENTTGVTDAYGLPGHSINCVVYGGNDAQIADTIARQRGMGASMVGAQSAMVVGEDGEARTVRWDRATEINAYVVVTLACVPPGVACASPAGAHAAIADAIVGWFSRDGDSPALIGQSVGWFDMGTPINALGVTGRPELPSVTAIYLGSAPNPTTQADLVIARNAVALFDASRISVVGP